VPGAGIGSALGPRDVGHRVVVRRVVGLQGGRPVQSDALGVLTRVTETLLTVRTTDGDIDIERAAVTAAKRVPDRRARSATERLELVAAAGWPPVEKSFLGDWQLRASGGWTGRGNWALAVGDPGRPIAAAVDAVTDWYRERGLRPTIAVPLPLGRRVQPELDRRGWDTSMVSLVQTAVLADLPASDASDVMLLREPTEEWLASVGGRKGGLPPAARTVLTGVPTARYAAGYADGSLVATARGTVIDGWLGIAVVGVDPGQRRRGWARRLTLALAGWAADEGAERAYLQVEETNTAARQLYERLGFHTAHGYVTRRSP
jgi:ribosomal protein S18 acetylase RimI-like enzyme